MTIHEEISDTPVSTCERNRKSGLVDLITEAGATGFFSGLMKLCTASSGQ